MNYSISRFLIIAMSGLMFPMTISAHTLNGVLGKNTSAHYYQLVCGTDSRYLYFDVKSKGTAVSPIVSAQLSKDNFAESLTDPNNTDALSSRGVQINAGDGTYHLTISKSKLGLAKYSIQYHCKDDGNNHTLTDEYPIETKK